MMLLDGNSCVFAMHKLGTDCMSPPGWLDLPSLRCATMASVPLPQLPVRAGSGGGRGVLTVLGLEALALMPHILRADLDKVKEVLSAAHAKPTAEERAAARAELLAERCDGNRNLLHVAVAMCAPQSNRESNEAESHLEEGGGGGGGSGGNGGGGGGSGGNGGAGGGNPRVRRITVQPK